MSQYSAEDIQKLFRMLDETKAAFNARLAQRSDGRVLYDTYLVAQLRKGKPFKIALRKANTKFPAVALNPADEDLPDTERHYQFFIEVDKMDAYRRQIQECDRKIAETDRKIAEFLEAHSLRADQPGAAVGPERAEEKR